MRFVSIRQILNQLKVEFTTIDETVVKSAQTLAKQHFLQNKKLKINQFEYTKDEIDFVLNSLDDKTLVFHDWVQQDSSLSQYLISLGEIRNKPKPNQYEGHQLEKVFQSYLAPFLKPILEESFSKNLAIPNLQILSEHIVFSNYLEEGDRIEVQQPISDFVRKLMENKKIDFFELIYTATFVDVLNKLDKHFYSNSVLFIDKTKKFIISESLIDTQKGKIRKLLLQLKLTERHQKEVAHFANSEHFKAQSSASKKGLIKFLQPYIIYILGGILIVSLTYFYLNKPSPNKEKEIATGAEELTDEELLELDSLIKVNGEKFN